MKNLLVTTQFDLVDIHYNIDSRHDEVNCDYPVDLRIGRTTYHDLNESELKDLFIFQYIITAKKVG